MVRKAPPEPERTAYARALGRLARRDHSQAELKRALLDRGHPPDEVEAAVDRLRAERFLDDGSFAERFARSRLQNYRLGRHRIRQSLHRRGVERQVAEAGLRKALDDAPEHDAIDALARRYWQSHRRDEPALRVRRLWGFLLRRGFPATLVSERLRALWPRWRDALEGLEPLDTEDQGS
jgi:regulatory protein